LYGCNALTLVAFALWLAAPTYEEHAQGNIALYPPNASPHAYHQQQMDGYGNTQNYSNDNNDGQMMMTPPYSQPRFSYPRPSPSECERAEK
jgi:hypothetical protein